MNWASFGGGTSIYLQGVGLSINDTESHQIVFESVESESFVRLVGPRMTNDDGLLSDPALGRLAYRTPSLWDLTGMTQAEFGSQMTMAFYVHVIAPSEDGPKELRCGEEQCKCKIVYRRDYTPSIHHISPRVVYADLETDLWFDPRSTMDLLEEADELPFVNARIGGYLVDYTNTVGSNMVRCMKERKFDFLFCNQAMNRVRGSVG